MRLALLSDIHGNSLALDAVLNDIQAHGPIDRYVLVGDYLAIGPDPAGVMARLLGLSNAVFVRGNTDHDLIHLWSDDLAQANPPQLPHALGYFIDVMWTRGAVNQPDWLDWLAALPIEQRLTLPDGTRLLAVHASPGQHDGAGVHPRRSPEQLRESLAACRRKEHRTRIFRINADLKQTFIKKSAKISAQSVRVPFGFSVASPTGC